MLTRQAIAFTCACITLSTLACNISATVTPTSTPSLTTETPVPAPTELAVGPMQPTVTLDEFAGMLEDALNSEDSDLIRPLMGEAFSISYVDASGGFIATDDALNLLQTEFLAAPPPISFDDSIETSLIQGDVPDPGGLAVAGKLFSRGWGVEGQDHAIVLIAVSADGSFYFGGVIYARGGFTSVPESPTPTVAQTPPPQSTVASIEASPAPHGSSIYHSDFLSGWALFDELQVHSSHTDEGFLMNVLGPWAGWTYTTRLHKSEFYAEITARPSNCPSGQGTYGLIFHYENDTQFRAFAVWCSGLFSAFERTEASRADLLIEGTLPQGVDVSTGDHRIGVLAHGGTLHLFVDDYAVGRIGVAKFPEGDIGPYVESIGAQAVSILFTDLNVYTP